MPESVFGTVWTPALNLEHIRPASDGLQVSWKKAHGVISNKVWSYPFFPEQKGGETFKRMGKDWGGGVYRKGRQREGEMPKLN